MLSQLQRGRSTSGMTLLEILAVVGIIATLSTLAIPAVSSISQGRAVTQAVSLTSDAMTLARQSAIASGNPVALILSRPSDVNTPQGILLLHGTRSANSFEWRVKAPWVPLPTGAHIVPQERDGRSTFFSETGGAITGGLPLKMGRTEVLEYDYIIFRADGTVDAPQEAPSAVARNWKGPSSNSFRLLTHQHSGRLKIVTP